MSTWLVPYEQLAAIQKKAVRLRPDKHRLVLGLPGAGKTQVLIHRAALLRKVFHVPPERFRIFIFTNVLRDFIRSGLKVLDLPLESASTFDAWCVDFHKNKIARPLPRLYRGDSWHFPQVRKNVLGYLQDHTHEKLFDFVLIDEGQDLTREAFEILIRVSHHLTVFADYQQQIFRDAADLSAILDALAIPAPTLSLEASYRNSPYVAQLAAYLIPDRATRRRFIECLQTQQVSKERPLLYIAESFDDEMDRLAEIILQRRTLNERIGVFLPRRNELESVVGALKARGIEIEHLVPPPAPQRATGETFAHFDNDLPKLTTYHSAKGLTFDSVLLPRLTSPAFGSFFPGMHQQMILIGMLRAIQWLYFSSDDYELLDLGGTFQQAERNRHLTIQEERPWDAGPAAAPGAGEEAQGKMENGRRQAFQEEEEDFSVF